MSPNIKKALLERWEERLEKRTSARSRKAKPRMKVSGAGVKQLQRIIAKKS